MSLSEESTGEEKKKDVTKERRAKLTLKKKEKKGETRRRKRTKTTSDVGRINEEDSKRQEKKKHKFVQKENEAAALPFRFGHFDTPERIKVLFLSFSRLNVRGLRLPKAAKTERGDELVLLPRESVCLYYSHSWMGKDMRKPAGLCLERWVVPRQFSFHDVESEVSRSEAQDGHRELNCSREIERRKEGKE